MINSTGYRVIGGAVFLDRYTAPVSPVSITATRASANVNEGDSLSFTVSGSNITNGTYYWRIDSNPEDFTISTDSFNISNNSGSFSVTPIADLRTEGNEALSISIRSGTTTGPVLATVTATVDDTSVYPPTYVLTNLSGDTASEGSSSIFTLSGNNIIDGTYWYTVNHITTDASEFRYYADSGAFNVVSNYGNFSLIPEADLTTEGNQTFTVSVRKDSTVSPILVTSNVITLLDTSQTPIPYGSFKSSYIVSDGLGGPDTNLEGNTYAAYPSGSYFSTDKPFAIEFWYRHENNDATLVSLKNDNSFYIIITGGGGGDTGTSDSTGHYVGVRQYNYNPGTNSTNEVLYSDLTKGLHNGKWYYIGLKGDATSNLTLTVIGEMGAFRTISTFATESSYSGYLPYYNYSARKANVGTGKWLRIGGYESKELNEFSNPPENRAAGYITNFRYQQGTDAALMSNIYQTPTATANTVLLLTPVYAGNIYAANAYYDLGPRSLTANVRLGDRFSNPDANGKPLLTVSNKHPFTNP